MKKKLEELKNSNWRSIVKHSAQWMCVVALALILTFAVGKNATVYADTSTNLSFGQRYSGTTENGLNKYYFTLPKAGRITISTSTSSKPYSVYTISVRLLNANFEEVAVTKVGGSNYLSCELAAGTYELDVASGWGVTDYTISVQYTSANETYTYPNNMYIDVANKAAVPFQKKITGHLAINDNIDYYKLVMPSAGTLNLAIVTEQDDVEFSIRDKQDNVVKQSEFRYEGARNVSYILNKGTYYLRFKRGDTNLYYGYSDYFDGKYYFTPSYIMEAPANVTISNVTPTSFKLSAAKRGDITGYNIRYKRGSASWKKLNVKGNKNLNKAFTKLAPGVYKVQVQSYYKYAGKVYTSEWSPTKTASCELKKPSALKAVNSSKKAMRVTSSKKGTITGYEIRYRMGSGKWKTVTVKGNRNLNKTIKGLKKGASYRVQVRTYYKSGKTYYSPWSVTKTVKIKK